MIVFDTEGVLPPTVRAMLLSRALRMRMLPCRGAMAQIDSATANDIAIAK